MRVLSRVVELDGRHGEAINSAQILSALAHQGHDVDVAYQYDGPLRALYEGFASSLRQVGPAEVEAQWQRAWDPGASRQALALLEETTRILPSVASSIAGARRTRPDVVLEPRIPGMVWATAVARAARAAAVCQVNVLLDLRPARDRLLLAGADRVIAVSGFIRDQLRASGVSDERIAVVHNGIDPDRYPYGGPAELAAARHALGLGRDVPVILYYGQLNPIKGVDVLLEAVDLLPGPVKLVVAGAATDVAGGYEAELHRRARRFGAGHEISWLPHAHDVVPLLHAADVVVLPSVREEAFGRVLIEAMSSGRPVVASRIGGIPEVLGKEYDGWLAAPRDPADLAVRLAGLLDWRERDPGLGERLRRRVQTKFTLGRVIDQTEAVLEDAIADRASRRHRQRRRVAAA